MEPQIDKTPPVPATQKPQHEVVLPINAPSEPDKPQRSPTQQEMQVKRVKNDSTDVDAVALLLDLAKSQEEGSNEGGEGKLSSSPGPQRGGLNRTYNAQLATVNSMDHPHLTKKGTNRLQTSDNRVRPPKAATRLLPEEKWRHIRLPDVESALRAEDLVVLWAHFRHSDVLTREKVANFTNFALEHYDERELRPHLESISTAVELENYLKERYGVLGSHSAKRAKTGTSPTDAASPTEVDEHGQGNVHQRRSTPPPPSEPKNEIASLLYIGAGLDDGKAKAAAADDPEKNLAGDGCDTGSGAEPEKPNNYKPAPTNALQPPAPQQNTSTKAVWPSSTNDLLQQQPSILPSMLSTDISANLIDPAALFAATNGMTFPQMMPPNVASGPQQPNVPFPVLPLQGWGALLANPFLLGTLGDMPTSMSSMGLPPPTANDDAPKGHPTDVSVPPRGTQLGFLPESMSTHHLSVPEQLAILGFPPLPNSVENQAPKKNQLDYNPKRHAPGSNAPEQQKYLPGERPGRPPSYDDMVVWCVELKRYLWQHHAGLTIEEAIQMVNDPAYYPRPQLMEGIGKRLVASTLRKRVLGIFKMTWSQVATDSDTGLKDKITNPSVLAAAAVKLKQHGAMDGPIVVRGNDNNGLIGNSCGVLTTAGSTAMTSTGADKLKDNNAVNNINDIIRGMEVKNNANKNNGGGGGGPMGTMTVTMNASIEEAKNATAASAGDVANIQYMLPPPQQRQPNQHHMNNNNNSHAGNDSVLTIVNHHQPLQPPSTLNALAVPQQGQSTQAMQLALPPGMEIEVRELTPGSGAMAFDKLPADIGGVDQCGGQRMGAISDALLGSLDGVAVNAPLAINTDRLQSFKEKIWSIQGDDTDDTMFAAMCDLHCVNGISKQECATVCRMWMENILSDIQKKQLVTFIKANIDDENLIAEWIKSLIRALVT